jgi:hypothetical protein
MQSRQASLCIQPSIQLGCPAIGPLRRGITSKALRSPWYVILRPPARIPTIPPSSHGAWQTCPYEPGGHQWTRRNPCKARPRFPKPVTRHAGPNRFPLGEQPWSPHAVQPDDLRRSVLLLQGWTIPTLQPPKPLIISSPQLGSPPKIHIYQMRGLIKHRPHVSHPPPPGAGTARAQKEIPCCVLGCHSSRD